jgi:hypothetical protein
MIMTRVKALGMRAAAAAFGISALLAMTSEPAAAWWRHCWGCGAFAAGAIAGAAIANPYIYPRYVYRPPPPVPYPPYPPCPLYGPLPWYCAR